MKFLTGRLFALAAIFALPFTAIAESNLASAPTSGTKLSTTARLDFQVTIPAMLYLQVGADPATATTAHSRIGQIAFDVASGSVGNGMPVDATFASGDRNNGTVTARITSNVGPVDLRSETMGPLQSNDPTSTDTIPWSQIVTVSNTLTGAGTASKLAHPMLIDNGATTLHLLPSGTGKIVQQAAEWTYKYLNSVVVPAGIYGDATTGNGSRNGRVIYTAAMP